MSKFLSKKQKDMILEYAKAEKTVEITWDEAEKLIAEIEEFRVFSDYLQEQLAMPQDEKIRKRFYEIEKIFVAIMERTSPNAQATTLVFNLRECFDKVYALAFEGMRHIPELGEEYRNG